MVLYGIVDEEILAALGHLPKYPTCSKAVCWHGIHCTVNFAWPVKPSLQYGSAPCSGLLFFVIGSGDLREYNLLVRMRGLVRAGGSQNFVWVFQVLSIAQYFCTMAAKSAKCAMSRRLMALRIPLSVQFLQKNEIASSLRQSLTLLITRRNLA